MEQPTAPLFTTRFVQGSRTFFFDVKKTKTDKPFLKITSTSIKGEEKKRTYMMIFDNEVQGFIQAASDAVGYILKA